MLEDRSDQIQLERTVCSVQYIPERTGSNVDSKVYIYMQISCDSMRVCLSYAHLGLIIIISSYCWFPYINCACFKRQHCCSSLQNVNSAMELTAELLGDHFTY
ncbi:hypothetical protein O6H91_08G118300 [Diphasiastrum complanatum]|uniref:Uncharacterized protein n=1 Tax=Diphasiastrum complanatum TaxID=34168 RepID=A0ACC2D1E3_DIPCM|nr:hypothetical protein O6H91_08G118300 [Diphasiastrum complanatum]